MNPLGAFTPMYTQPHVNKNAGGVSGLPQEFMSAGEYMFYDVANEEEDKKEDSSSEEYIASRGELVKKDLEHLPFLVHETEHFEFHYLPDSDAAKELDTISAKREDAWRNICDFFFINPPDKHIFYIFQNDKQAYCPTWGKTFASRALPEEHMAGILYLSDPHSYENVNYGHELTHLLEFYLLPPSMRVPPYLREGIADLLSQSNCNMHLRYINFLKSGLAENAFTMTDEKINNPEYMESASFLQYLSEISDKNRMLEFYRKTSVLQEKQKMPTDTFSDIFTATFGINLKNTMNTFYNYICSLWNCQTAVISPQDANDIKNLIKQSDLVCSKEDQSAINELYSNDFYHTTPASERDLFIYHMMPLENMESVNFEFFDLGTWLYGKSAAVHVDFKNKATGNTQKRVFAVEKLMGRWRLSPKYPGGKEIK